MRGYSWLLAAVLALMLGSASAETQIYRFTMDEVPPTLRWGVTEYKNETTVTLTFAGDCTLGGEAALRSSRNSFAARVAQNGMAYPFAGLQPLFSSDDFTLINLEGVLGDSIEGKVEKQYNFIGDSAYTAILTEGSVECVNLANNHAMDFGSSAYLRMTGYLDEAGVGYVSEETLCLLEKDGVRIGLTASLFALSDKKQARLKQQMALLRDLGCQIIIHSMHGGEEYAPRASDRQRQTARAAIECGAALVVGHHPHILQNAALYQNAPIIYSLGNNSFGGNFNPADKDALLLRAAFHFKEGEAASLDWSLYPITISGTKNGNDYQPALLAGDEAERVIGRVADLSDIALAPFAEGIGAAQATIDYKGE